MKQKTVKRSMMIFLTALFIMALAAPVIYASPTGADLANKAAKFFNDGLTWILILVIPVGGLWFAYHALMKMQTEEPAEIASRNKKMKNILVGVAIVESSLAIVKIISSYF
jgi:hypothetical protein